MLIESPTPDQMTVAVVGAGIAGLCAAYHLAKQGFGVEIFEASGRPGGTLYTHEEGHWRAELGPNTVPNRGVALMELVDELGLRPKLLKPSATSPRRFIVHQGTLCPLPSDPVAFAQTPLLSATAKLRLLAEPVLPTREKEPEFDESLYSLAARRLGPEVVDTLLDPFVAGTYAGSVRRLSSRFALKMLGELEQEYGSIFRGALSLMRQRAKQRSLAPYAPAPSTGSLINFDQGIETLPKAIAHWLRSQPKALLHLNQPVHKLIHQGRQGWSVHHGESQKTVDACVLALPAHVLPALALEDATGGLKDASFGFLEAVEHPPVGMVALGFRRSQIRHPLDGFGMLIPTKERRNILGAVFNSSIFPTTAPKDHVLLTGFIGGARDPELAQRPPGAQVELMLAELRELVGLKGQPVFLEQRVWPRSIPQYNVGYERILAQTQALEDALPGLGMTGNWRAGISVADTAAHAKAVALRLGQHLYP